MVEAKEGIRRIALNVQSTASSLAVSLAATGISRFPHRAAAGAQTTEEARERRENRTKERSSHRPNTGNDPAGITREIIDEIMVHNIAVRFYGLHVVDPLT